MKVIYNGGLNCSILDGWWAEGYTHTVGWAIGNGEEYPEYEWDHQDFVESEALYNILEHDIIPLFYDRAHTVPREWIADEECYRELAPFSIRIVWCRVPTYVICPLIRVHRSSWQTNWLRVSPRCLVQKIESAWRNLKISEVDVPKNDQGQHRAMKLMHYPSWAVDTRRCARAVVLRAAQHTW
jgi:starch phosphorylase